MTLRAITFLRMTLFSGSLVASLFFAMVCKWKDNERERETDQRRTNWQRRKTVERDSWTENAEKGRARAREADVGGEREREREREAHTHTHTHHHRELASMSERARATE